MKKTLCILVISLLFFNIFMPVNIFAANDDILGKLEKFLQVQDDKLITNASKLGLNMDDYNIDDLSGVILNSDKTSIIEINWSNKDLYGNLDLSKFSDIEKINIENNNIVTLSLNNLTKLKYLYANNNNMTNIELNDCTNLKDVDLSNNFLYTISTSENKINKLNVSNNLLNFNELVNIIDRSEAISYSPQKPLFVITHDVNTIFMNKPADFSFYGADEFTWHDTSGNILTPKTVKNDYTFLFDESFLNSSIYCVMKSDSVKDLTILTEIITIIPKDYTLLVYSICLLIIIVFFVIIIKVIMKNNNLKGIKK